MRELLLEGISKNRNAAQKLDGATEHVVQDTQTQGRTSNAQHTDAEIQTHGNRRSTGGEGRKRDARGTQEGRKRDARGTQEVQERDTAYLSGTNVTIFCSVV